MQIREAEIFSFGKLKEKKIQFEPGINVIYGANEAGKSTVHAFLLAMLFGMDKGRGRAPVTDSYQRYEPWHSPAYYSGALRFEVEGRPFFLERNFYYREKRDFLRNEADGEELSIAYGDLTMLLGGIHKETFGNTYDIPQSGAVTGKELADSLAEYLSDAAESGDSGFRVTRAVEMLREKKKKLSAALKKVQSEKEQRQAALRIEQEILQRDCLKLREDIAEAKLRMEDKHTESQSAAAQMADRHAQSAVAQMTESNQINEQRAKNRMRMGSRMFVLAAFLAAGMVLILFVGKDALHSTEAFWFMTGGLGLAAFGFALLGGIAVWHAKKQRIPLPVEQEAPTQEPNHAEQMLAILHEALDEKETRLYNIAEQLEQLSIQTDCELELQREIDAVQLAADELERLAKEFCEEAGDALNGEVSRYVSAITGGRYDSVRVDENGKLWVLINGKEVSPEALSRGTLEQFYLALRLAVGETVTREETMPIFLDEAFAQYDDARLEQTLKVLSGMDRQILIFTCQNREAELLSKIGISYHKIDL